MVVQSKINYKKWKKEVQEIYGYKYGLNKAEEFIKFISERYDKSNMSFLPHKVLWRLYDLQNKVVNSNQHQVYGSFGRGGYGKTTLMKNVLYFHDPTFDQSRIANTTEQFHKVLYDVLKRRDRGRFRAILIDEPSKETHSGSREWRITEDVLGQIRQANLFLGVCATKLDNIKPSLYVMITGLFAFRQMFIYDYYDEEKTEGIVGKIRQRYDQTKTYECFSNKDIQKKVYIRNFYSIKSTPIDYQQEDYDYQKKKTFMDKLRKLHNISKTKEIGSKKLNRLYKRNSEICEDYKTGNFTQKELGKKYNLTRRTIVSIIGKYDEM